MYHIVYQLSSFQRYFFNFRRDSAAEQKSVYNFEPTIVNHKYDGEISI